MIVGNSDQPQVNIFIDQVKKLHQSAQNLLQRISKIVQLEWLVQRKSTKEALDTFKSCASDITQQMNQVYVAIGKPQNEMKSVEAMKFDDADHEDGKDLHFETINILKCSHYFVKFECLNDAETNFDIIHWIGLIKNQNWI